MDSTKTIFDTVSGSKMKVLSSEAHSKHGYKPSCVIFDELHAQPNRDLWDVMTFGAGAARRQPVWIVLTTAGDDPDRKSIGWEVHEKALGIWRYRRGRPRRAGAGRSALAADHLRPRPRGGRGQAPRDQHFRRAAVARLQPVGWADRCG
ncbi:MAG: terminase large subunit domain-containing protein [Butyricicoccaceae bacterium]